MKHRISIILLRNGVLIVLAVGKEIIMAPDPNQRAQAGIQSLLMLYNRTTGLWRTTGWWNAANALHCIIDFVERTGNTAYASVVSNSFEHQCRGHFINDFYDDEGWWALTWVAAYRVFRDKRYLDAARTLFDDMRTGWDGVCGGGIWWNKRRQYKNAIANELFLKVAAQLFRWTNNQSHHDWAQRAWDWFSASGLINEYSLVNDGLSGHCRNNGGITWTYNQGVILGGLVALHAISGDDVLIQQARAIADAAIAALCDEDGVLREPNEPDLGNDGPQFKGIFVRNLAELYSATLEPHYRDFLRRNAEAVWNRNRSLDNFFGVQWSGPFDRADAARQSSAIDALNAVLLT
jgi:predicted alpha-1,6-mannanase (GH76 family)